MESKTSTRRGLVAVATFALALSTACSPQAREEMTETVDVASPEQIAIEAIESVRGDLVEVRDILTSAADSPAKGVTADLLAFDGDLNAVEELLNAADDALFEGEFSRADSLAISAAEAVGAVRGALAGASDSR